jgi:hypothetical protein
MRQRRRRRRRRRRNREVGGEKVVPERVFGGETMKETACDGDATKILVG